MLSLPLLRTTIKFNYVIWLIFAGILAMYLSIIASMFDPTAMENMDALVASLPPQLVDAMNFKTSRCVFSGIFGGLLLRLPDPALPIHLFNPDG
jgi:hypothetical protein